jgi:uncharacterized protein YjiS (DUF1127 family)
MMSFRALVEKAPDADILREMIAFAGERLRWKWSPPGFRTGAAHGEGSPDRLAQRLFEQIADRRVVRRDLNRLMEFDDRQLADIGLNRGALLHLVRYGRLPSHSNQRL